MSDGERTMETFDLTETGNHPREVIETVAEIKRRIDMATAALNDVRKDSSIVKVDRLDALKDIA